MFRRSSEPLPLSEASLLALRPALNAPVLNVKFLPVGPARAAIVVFAEEYGGIGLAIGVRSNEGGQVVVFRNQEPIDASVPVADALESALSSAERLGFLFDEDMVEGIEGGQGRSEAMALWGRLMGEIEIPFSPAISESAPDSDSGSVFNTAIIPEAVPELVLDDVAAVEPLEISLELEADETDIELDLDDLSMGESLETTERVLSEGPAADPPPSPIPPEQQLSKFRSVPPNPESAENVKDVLGADVSETSELGRIPIVRVRRKGSKRVPYLARLLSSF